MPRLHGKVAVVTGSSSGIGKAIALRFAEAGARVVVTARRMALCEQTAGQIRERGGEAQAIRTDVTDERQVEALFESVMQAYERVDILVNNAGVMAGGRLVETSLEDFDRVMQTNLQGTFLCARAGFRWMRQQGGGGVILNMSSVAGVQAWAGTGVYSASKHGIMALTRALAEEGRPHGIKVSAICPGAVADELVDASPDVIQASEKISPYDIAETALFLATLGPQAVVHQIVVDRLGADW